FHFDYTPLKTSLFQLIFRLASCLSRVLSVHSSYKDAGDSVISHPNQPFSKVSYRHVCMAGSCCTPFSLEYRLEYRFHFFHTGHHRRDGPRRFPFLEHGHLQFGWLPAGPLNFQGQGSPLEAAQQVWLPCAVYASMSFY